MNKKAFLLLLLLITACVFLSTPVFAAWTQAKGHSYNQLTFSYYKSNEKFSSIEESSGGSITGDVKKIDQPEYVDYKLSYYGEFGVLDKLTVFTSVPYAWVRSEDVNSVKPNENGPSGIGDIDLGIRYKLFDNLFGSGMLMSFQGTVKIPEAYEFENPISHQNLGDGQYDTTLALLFGKGFNKGYMVINAGYKFRLENDFEKSMSFKPSDQIKLRVDGGYQLFPKLSLRGNLEWTKSTGNASISKGMVNYYIETLGGKFDDENKIIKDTLSLEPDNVTLGIAFAYSISSNITAVLSYNTVIAGIGGDDSLITKDSGKGDTYAIALAYSY